MEFLSPKPRFKLYGGLARYQQVLGDVLFSKVNQGDDIDRFEDQIRQFCQVKFVKCVPQNRVGIYAVLSTLVKPGHGVIMSPYTISDMVNMVLLAGARPIFCDIDRKTCNLDTDSVLQLLDTEVNVGAVIITHLHGLTCSVEKIREKCKGKNVIIIEDAAQAFGAKDKGRRTGTLGDVGVFSFGMYKNVSTWYGGAVVTEREEIAEKISNFFEQLPHQNHTFFYKKIRKGLLSDIATSDLLFQLVTFWIFRFGFLNDVTLINKMVMTELDHSRKEQIPAEYLANMTPMQARIGLKQIADVDRKSAERIEYAKKYHEGLKDIKDIIIPPLYEDFSHIYTYFPIQYVNRNDLLKFMMRGNRDIAAQHYKNCADLPWLKKYYLDCPNARQVSSELIFLPTYPGYGNGEVDKNIKLIREYFS